MISMIIEVCRNHYEEGKEAKSLERPHAKRLVHDFNMITRVVALAGLTPLT